MNFDFESIGLSLGLMKGDEIMVINGAIVSDLDMMFIESVLQEELTLCMMLRSSRPGKLYGTLHATFTQPLCLIDVVMVVELEIQANNFLLKPIRFGGRSMYILPLS